MAPQDTSQEEQRVSFLGAPLAVDSSPHPPWAARLRQTPKRQINWVTLGWPPAEGAGPPWGRCVAPSHLDARTPPPAAETHLRFLAGVLRLGALVKSKRQTTQRSHGLLRRPAVGDDANCRGRRARGG